MRVWGINIFALNGDELISERWGQFDVLTMMQQLGVAPGPPMPEAPEEGPEYGDPRRAGRAIRRSDIEANKAVYRADGRRGRQQGQLRRRRRALPSGLRRPRRAARHAARARRGRRRSSRCSAPASRT